MKAHSSTGRGDVLVTAVLIGLFSLGCFAFLASPVEASSDPSIARSTSISCVFNVSPCTQTLSVSLTVSQGDTVVVWTSNYAQNCGVPVAISVSDSFGSTYTSIGSQEFQFAACGAQLQPALDAQSAYYSAMQNSGVVTVSVSFSNANPYEADLIVDDIPGASFSGYQMTYCSGTEPTQQTGAHPCINGPGSFNVPQLASPFGALVIAYGTASGGSTITENQLSPGPGYATDQGPVYPGGYQLDSLTEYSVPNGPTTSQIDTTGVTGGWGEIAIILSAAGAVTVTQTVTTTQTMVLMSTVSSYSVVTQTTTLPVTTILTSTTTATVTYTPQELVPGVGNDTLILAVAVLVAAIIVALSFVVVAKRRQ